MTKRINCEVREGRFIDGCVTLEEMVANHTPGFSSTKGIAYWQLTNMATHKPSRSYYGVKTKEHPKGFLFNFCPFCGTQIDAPFNKDDES